jgi:methylphosphotriester-DNA--protein-cysteine methyltransferase
VRVFHWEVGTDFEWCRRQVRLMKAIELLVSGHRVKEVAFSVGATSERFCGALPGDFRNDGVGN